MLKSQVKKIPDASGVYLFLDKKGKVLYVGRATSLKRRVLSYFQKKLDPRLKEMVDSSYQLRYQKTETILDSVILEANLIKKYWPKYNVKEKDNRSFVYIVISKDKYPKPLIVRARELSKFPKTKYIFGPYQSLKIANKVLSLIRRIFPYSTCQPLSGKPCFHYQIGLCPGICIGKISQKEYQKNISNFILFLKGEKKQLVKKLKKQNSQKAESLKYIQDLVLLTKEDYQLSIKFNRIEGYDISHFSGKESYGSMVVFTDGKPDKENYRLFKIKKSPLYDDLRALEEVIIRRFNHPQWHFPDLILIDGGRPQVDYISKILEAKHINIPLVGISKFKDDKLIFPKATKKSLKQLIEDIREILLRVREEAHRFSLRASRRRRRLN